MKSVYLQKPKEASLQPSSLSLKNAKKVYNLQISNMDNEIDEYGKPMGQSSDFKNSNILKHYDRKNLKKGKFSKTND